MWSPIIQMSIINHFGCDMVIATPIGSCCYHKLIK